MSQPLIFTIIINSNRLNDTLACIDSLDRNTYRNNKVIVLDIDSKERSVNAIRSSFPLVDIIPLSDNRGYAGNNNIGLENAIAKEADWVFVLNDDTILDPNCLSHLVRVGESSSDIGVVGPMVYHYDEPNIIQSAGGKMNRFWEPSHIAQNQPEKGQFRNPHNVDWISGCAILLRRAAIEQVGMLDARFFCYWEETEWCLRGRKGGWRIVQVPQAKLWHKGVQRNHNPKPTVTYYSTRNHLLMLAKHHAPLNAWGYSWVQIIRTLTSWTIKSKWHTKREHRDAMWRGVVDFLRHRWGGPVQL